MQHRPLTLPPLQLVNPVLGQAMGQAGREVSALVRTTCAVVGVQAGGVAHNVLPRSGTITINCRLLPGGPPRGAAFGRWLVTALAGSSLGLAAANPLHPACCRAACAGHDAAYVGQYLQLVTQKEAAHVTLRQLPGVRRRWRPHHHTTFPAYSPVLFFVPQLYGAACHRLHCLSG